MDDDKIESPDRPDRPDRPERPVGKDGEKSQEQFYKESQDYIEKQMNVIEAWLNKLPSRPQVQDVFTADASGVVTGVEPKVFDTVNKAALLAQWQGIREEIEWFKHMPVDVDG